MKLNLLSLDNPKTQKMANELGYIAASLPLAPHNYAGGKSLCPNAMKADCYTHCLFFSGHGGLRQHVKDSRVRKTKLFNENRKLFMTWLYADILTLVAKAESENKKVCIRLNTFTDINWAGIYLNDGTIFDHFPDVQFYDYTKVPRPLEKIPSNYHLTFSYSPVEEYQPIVKKAVKYKMNMTVVFRLDKGQSLPAIWNKKTVIDGDKHDFRFLDPDNCIVGLKEKRMTDKERAADKRIGLAVEI